MSNHLQRIEAVEKELKRLSSTSAVKEDVTKLRAEMKQVYVSPCLSFLEHCRAWGLIRCVWTGRTVSTLKYWTYEPTYGASNKTSHEALAIVSTHH